MEQELIPGKRYSIKLKQFSQSAFGSSYLDYTEDNNGEWIYSPKPDKCECGSDKVPLMYTDMIEFYNRNKNLRNK